MATSSDRSAHSACLGVVSCRRGGEHLGLACQRDESRLAERFADRICLLRLVDLSGLRESTRKQGVGARLAALTREVERLGQPAIPELATRRLLPHVRPNEGVVRKLAVDLGGDGGVRSELERAFECSPQAFGVVAERMRICDLALELDPRRVVLRVSERLCEQCERLRRLIAATGKRSRPAQPRQAFDRSSCSCIGSSLQARSAFSGAGCLAVVEGEESRILVPAASAP